MKSIHAGELDVGRLDAKAVGEILIIEKQVQPSPWSKSALEACFTNRLMQVFGLSLAKKLVAYAVVQQLDTEAEIQNLAVAKTHQGRGMGAHLLTKLVCYYRSAGVRRILLEVRASNTRALGLYRSFGFIEVGTRAQYYTHPAGAESAILMTCELNQ